MYAYSEKYLEDAMRNLGEAFDYAVNACNLSADDFLRLFVASGFADSFGHGSPRLVAGLSGTELVMETFTKAGLGISWPEPQIEYDCSPEYWCGWILAYYQWKTGRSFRNIQESISMQDILKLYPTLHEAAEDKFVDTVNSIIARNSTVSRLQRQRKRCGYSQRELAEKSGVNLRTLQQYELKTKDIGKASVRTVMALASSLGCQADALLEYRNADSEA